MVCSWKKKIDFVITLISEKDNTHGRSQKRTIVDHIFISIYFRFQTRDIEFSSLCTYELRTNESYFCQQPAQKVPEKTYRIICKKIILLKMLVFRKLLAIGLLFFMSISVTFRSYISFVSKHLLGKINALCYFQKISTLFLMKWKC